MIAAGNITLDDVPEKWRAEVEKLLPAEDPELNTETDTE
jgi:hypothetical protein